MDSALDILSFPLALSQLDQMLYAFDGVDQAALALQCSQPMECRNQSMEIAPADGTPRQHFSPAVPWDGAGEELGMPGNQAVERELTMTLSGTYPRPQPQDPARMRAPEDAAVITSHSASLTQVTLSARPRYP